MTDEKVKKETIAKFLEIEVDFVEEIQKQLLLKEKNANAKAIAKKLKVHPILVEILQADLKKKRTK
ncbi:MAG: hypothetical protein ACI9XO_002907 [Paraglaciecola sp.]|jgi:hypothetical protein